MKNTNTGMLLFFSLWALAALACLLPVSQTLNASFPILTVFWILVPLLIAIFTRDPSRVGFTTVPLQLLLSTTLINLGALMLLMLAFEPWSHTYQKLIELVIASATPDPTFAWLVRLPKAAGLAGMTFFSGLVTMFGEELFFRGWLIQGLQKKLGKTWSNVLQALLFTIPNLLLAFALPALQGVLYALVYAFIGIGLIGGWSATRTKSIWPSLISATLCNLVLVMLIFK